MVERASPFAGTVQTGRSGIEVSAPERGSLWQIACWPETFSSIETDLAQVCGCAAPGPGEAVKTVDGRFLIRIEPLKWWVLGEDGADCPLKPEAEAGAWLDMSHDQAAIDVGGSHARDLLKRMVSFDLRDTAFPDLRFGSTTLHHMFLKVLRHDDGGTPRYRLMVMRSYADDLREIVAHHLRHFG
ncbi:MAG: hypothetical protein AAFP68_14755 [Pseudomonadota bacterium]